MLPAEFQLNLFAFIKEEHQQKLGSLLGPEKIGLGAVCS